MDASTRFRLTWAQALGGGLALGLAAGVALLTVVAGLVAATGTPPSAGEWQALLLAPPLTGLAVGVAMRRRPAVDADSRGIPLDPFGEREPWERVVDLRAERRNSRTVVTVYLDEGTAVQLLAPYDGGLLAADPMFERKLFALATAWTSHRIGRSTV